MKRTSANYSKALALKHDIPEKKAKQLIVFMLKNFGRKIMHGQDIRIPHFGHIYFHKKTYVKYLAAVEKKQLKTAKTKQLKAKVREIKKQKD